MRALASLFLVTLLPLAGCLERWGADSTGVFVLDSPPMMPDASQINGSWQEDVLRGYLGER